MQCDQFPGATSQVDTLDGVEAVHAESIAFVAGPPRDHQCHDPRCPLNAGSRRHEDAWGRLATRSQAARRMWRSTDPLADVLLVH